MCLGRNVHSLSQSPDCQLTQPNNKKNNKEKYTQPNTKSSSAGGGGGKQYKPINSEHGCRTTRKGLKSIVLINRWNFRNKGISLNTAVRYSKRTISRMKK